MQQPPNQRNAMPNPLMYNSVITQNQPPMNQTQRNSLRNNNNRAPSRNSLDNPVMLNYVNDIRGTPNERFSLNTYPNGEVIYQRNEMLMGGVPNDFRKKPVVFTRPVDEFRNNGHEISVLVNNRENQMRAPEMHDPRLMGQKPMMVHNSSMPVFLHNSSSNRNLPNLPPREVQQQIFYEMHNEPVNKQSLNRSRTLGFAPNNVSLVPNNNYSNIEHSRNQIDISDSVVLIRERMDGPCVNLNHPNNQEFKLDRRSSQSSLNQVMTNLTISDDFKSQHNVNYVQIHSNDQAYFNTLSNVSTVSSIQDQYVEMQKLPMHPESQKNSQIRHEAFQHYVPVHRTHPYKDFDPLDNSIQKTQRHSANRTSNIEKENINIRSSLLNNESINPASARKKSMTEKRNSISSKSHPRKSALKKNKTTGTKKVTIAEHHNEHIEVTKWLKDIDLHDSNHDKTGHQDTQVNPNVPITPFIVQNVNHVNYINPGYMQPHQQVVISNQNHMQYVQPAYNFQTVEFIGHVQTKTFQF